MHVIYFLNSEVKISIISTQPTLVTLAWTHNHSISTSSALKHRDVNPETCRKLQELFEHAHSPSSALNILEIELQMEDPEKFVTQSADRACLQSDGKTGDNEAKSWDLRST